MLKMVDVWRRSGAVLSSHTRRIERQTKMMHCGNRCVSRIFDKELFYIDIILLLLGEMNSSDHSL